MGYGICSADRPLETKEFINISHGLRLSLDFLVGQAQVQMWIDVFLMGLLWHWFSHCFFP